MNGATHLPFAIDPSHARQTLARLDWPGGTAASAADFSFQKLWLPLDRITGANLLDKDRYGKLSRMVIPTTLFSTGTAVSGPPDAYRGITSFKSIYARTRRPGRCFVKKAFSASKPSAMSELNFWVAELAKSFVWRREFPKVLATSATA